MFISDLLQEEGSPRVSQLKYFTAQSHQDRVSALREILDYCCNELEKYRHLKKTLSEDQLTIEIVSNLTLLGIEADHDPQHGGHCDIVVKGSFRFIWIAEAKIYSSYVWLDKGFKQLATRYTTGVLGQDHGEVLIYCKAANAKRKLDKWHEELKRRNVGICTHLDPRGDPLSFWSIHKHEVSGLDFTTRHKIICLHHEPLQ